MNGDNARALLLLPATRIPAILGMPSLLSLYLGDNEDKARKKSVLCSLLPKCYSILSNTRRCSHCQQWTSETTLKMPDTKAVAWPLHSSGRQLKHTSICIPIMGPKVPMKAFLHVVTPTRQELNYMLRSPKGPHTWRAGPPQGMASIWICPLISELSNVAYISIPQYHDD